MRMFFTLLFLIKSEWCRGFKLDARGPEKQETKFICPTHVDLLLQLFAVLSKNVKLILLHVVRLYLLVNGV